MHFNSLLCSSIKRPCVVGGGLMIKCIQCIGRCSKFLYLNFQILLVTIELLHLLLDL